MSLTQREADGLERIFWATLGHTERPDDEDEAWASMLQDARAIADEIGADEADVRAFLEAE